VGQIFPDGDPIDYLAPWLEKHGIRDFKIGEILDRAAKKNGYEDLYDYYDSMKDQYARDNVAEGGYAGRITAPTIGQRLILDTSYLDRMYGYGDQTKGIVTRIKPNGKGFWAKVSNGREENEMEFDISDIIEQGVAESALEESDLILNPASLSKLSRDLVSHEHDRTDHEVEMAKSDLYQAGKNAVKIFELIKDISEEEGLEGWVQEKIIKANDYLNTIREYLEGKQMESMDGVAPGTKMFTSEEKPGLWANIHAKRKRIKSGSGERMRKPGSKGAPSAQDFKNSAK